jgi:hypothetical protein
MSSQWIPEFCYEEDENGMTSNLPFIPVPEGEKMPDLVYVFESKNTGIFEPGLQGEEVPVIEMVLHQYANMGILKERMSALEYDNVRFTMGLEPIKNAAIKGAKIIDNVRKNLS